MKVGPRKPSIKKAVKSRTTGKIKRQVKKSVNPLYGKKGMGYINNPKKAVYNKVYNKTSFDARPISFASGSSNKDKDVDSAESKLTYVNRDITTTEMILTVMFGYLGVHKFMNKEYLKGCGYLFTVGGFTVLWIRDSYIAIKKYLKR